MDWQLITLLGMFLTALLYIATLYHLAHGRERRAVELGARIVMEALTRDGRIMPDAQAVAQGEPLNLGEEDFMPQVDADGDPLPDIIVARNERMAQQIGDRILDDLMRHVDDRKNV